MTLKLKENIFDLSTPLVMGIVNVTPDSFYAMSRQRSEIELLQKIEQMLQEGAKIIDIGAYSSRPSASKVSEKEEIDRLTNALKIISRSFPEILVSVDTFRANVAKYVVQEFGVDIINDISGGTLDAGMFETIAKLKVAYILMHMRGTPETMQSLTEYDNVTAEVVRSLQQKIKTLRDLGVIDIIVDPGFGFAKNLEQNYVMLRELSYFSKLNAPLLVGISRKSMIYNLLGTDAINALNGTTVVNTLALMGGAKILRVHDVKEAVEAIKIFEQYKKL